MPEQTEQPRRGWLRKFADALRGIYVGVHGQNSFVVHFLVTVLVLAAAAWLRVSRIEWCLLVLCIAIVVAAELLNSALEMLAKAVGDGHNANIRNALDAASGAVLIASLGAAVTGTIIFVPHLLRQLA